MQDTRCADEFTREDAVDCTSTLVDVGGGVHVCTGVGAQRE